MTTFTLEDGTVLHEDDILKFDPETKRWYVEKDSLIGQLIEEICPITWTSTLPTESGYYWCRLGKTKPFLVDWEYADGDSFAWDIEKEQEIPQVLLLEHEWWSERVKPPEGQ